MKLKPFLYILILDPSCLFKIHHSAAGINKGHFTFVEAEAICYPTKDQNGAAEHHGNLLRWHSSRGFVCHVSPRLKYFSTLRIEAWQGALRCMTACLCCFLATTLSEDTAESSGRVPSACQRVSPGSDVRRLSADPHGNHLQHWEVKGSWDTLRGSCCSRPLYLTEAWSFCLSVFIEWHASVVVFNL